MAELTTKQKLQNAKRVEAELEKEIRQRNAGVADILRHLAGRPKNQLDSILGKASQSVTTAGTVLSADADILASKSGIIYSKVYRDYISQIGGTTEGISTSLNTLTQGLISTVAGWSEALRKNLEPVSDFMGSMLGTGTGTGQIPLSSIGLPRPMTSLLNSVDPGLGDRVNGSIQNLNIEGLSKLPGQVMSSVDQLITAIDNILAIPLTLLAEIYYGYMEIMKAISSLLSNIINSFLDFVLDFLDSIIPIKAILDLLKQVSSLASQIGGIASVFLGANQITAFTNQITNFSREIRGVLTNPTNTLVSLLPVQINQAINTIQNPQQIINKLLPPQLTQAFSQITKMTGFGFNGNMGYSFEAVLRGLQGGVIRSILTNFAQQYNVLGPILGGIGTVPQSYAPNLIRGTFNNAYINEPDRTAAVPAQWDASSAASTSQPQAQTQAQPSQATSNAGSNNPFYPYSFNNIVASNNILLTDISLNDKQPIKLTLDNPTVFPPTPCWVAREVYGVYNVKWVIFRNWLFTEGPEWLQYYYIKYGQQFAKWISNKPLLKRIIRMLMNTVVNKRPLQILALN